MAISIAACITSRDASLITALPATAALNPEVIVYRAQRNGYDQAARQTGAQFVEIGEEREELEMALSPRTPEESYDGIAWLYGGP